MQPESDCDNGGTSSLLGDQPSVFITSDNMSGGMDQLMRLNGKLECEPGYHIMVVSVLHQDGVELPVFSKSDIVWLLKPTLEGKNGSKSALCIGLSISIHEDAFPDVIALAHDKRMLLLQCPHEALEEESEVSPESTGLTLVQHLLLCSRVGRHGDVRMDPLEGTMHEGRPIQVASLAAAENAYLLYHAFRWHSTFLDLDVIAPSIVGKKYLPFETLLLLKKALGTRAEEVFAMTSSLFRVKSNNDTLNNYFLEGLIGTVRIAFGAHRVMNHFLHICDSTLDEGPDVIKEGLISTFNVPVRLIDYISRFEVVESALHLHKPKIGQARLRRATTSGGSVDVIEYKLAKNGKSFEVTNEQYKSRLVRNSRQKLEVSLTDAGGLSQRFSAMTMHSEGKVSSLKFVGDQIEEAWGMLREGAIMSDSRTVDAGPIGHIAFRGREDHSAAETDGMLWRRHLLQSGGEVDVDKNPFLYPFFLGDPFSSSLKVEEKLLQLMGRPQKSKYLQIALREGKGFLNPSQARAARAIMSPLQGKHLIKGEAIADRLVLIHGPPGTGKTSLITACCEQWQASCIMLEGTKEGACDTVYACCQSNVAVKNIAESFSRAGIRFVIIVSPNFYVEWHEDLYEDIRHRLIRSDELPTSVVKLSALLDGCSVVLSTVSFLSSSKVAEGGRGSCPLFTLRPMRLLFVDEASQIHLRAYPHLLQRFGGGLARVIFLGDDSQLPPFQGDEIVDAGLSVFQLAHLRKKAFLLDTCYRLAKPMARFISDEVYDGNIKCGAKNFDPKGGLLDCVAFIDVASSIEQRRGTSRVNHPECEMVVKLVKEFVKRGGSVSQIKALTLYDAQRDLLEESLKGENLSGSSDVVFSVDSFQGRESDYIILSLVRDGRPKVQQSKKSFRERETVVKYLQPGLGFTSNSQRLNVALTRARKGVVIVSNRRFINDAAAETLLGKLQIEMQWSSEGGELHWFDESDIRNQRLPTTLFPLSSGSVHHTKVSISADGSDVRSAPVQTGWE